MAGGCAGAKARLLMIQRAGSDVFAASAAFGERLWWLLPCFFGLALALARAW
ncbi:MAG TPA: hypothetical protein VGI10_19200 [Polyangiaceae bacterium]